ncbi:MAG: hypothetical protein HY520_05185, partial [Candidatus Aenigmarchaeota archaeon]|nr:hypothetical protein [Candidatus Aenigmarchaeota archaeon]
GGGSAGSGGGGGGGGGSGGSTQLPDFEDQLPGMSLEYITPLRVAPGQSAMAMVRVRNTGQTALSFTRLLGRSNGFPFLVDPEVIPFLPPGGTGVFLLSLDIPATLAEGKYRLAFTVTADETAESGEIEVVVAPSLAEDDIGDTIRNYEYLLLRLEGEADLQELLGKDVGQVRQVLVQAREELERAKRLHGLENYAEARRQLREVRLKLREAVRLLAELQLPQEAIALPGFLVGGLGGLLLFLVMVLLLLLARKRKKKPEEEPAGETAGPP